MAEREKFKSLEIDCEKGFMAINGKEIDVSTITSVDIHIRAGIIVVELGVFITEDFCDGRAETS